MTSGKRIDDRSFFAGKESDKSVFPSGVHTKTRSDDRGAGEIRVYHDTDEAIVAAQREAVRKVRAHPMREPDYRN